MTSTARTKVHATSATGTQHRWEAISEPGTYQSNWSGHLIRIPAEALKPGHSPAIEIRGRDDMVVTKLSDDPFVCISTARMAAADLDLEVNF